MSSRRAKPPLAESPDGVARQFVEAIGATAAMRVSELLDPLLGELAARQSRPACLPCAATAKKAERAWEIAAKNAAQAAEPAPDKPDLRVAESFTDGMRGPVCWDCFDPDKDAYPELSGTGPLEALLPPAVD